MRVQISANDDLVSRSQPCQNLSPQVFVKGQARIPIIVSGLKVGPVLGPDRSGAQLVGSRAVKADTPKVHAILARKSRPCPAAEPGLVATRTCRKVGHQAVCENSCSTPLSIFGDKGSCVVAAAGSSFVGVQFMTNTAEPLLAITQSIPIEAQFLEKSNTDLVAPKDIKELMFFGVSNCGGQAPKLKEGAAQVASGKVTPKVTKIYIIFIMIERGCKFLIQFFICTCRTDLRRRGPRLLVPSTSGASVPSRKGCHPQGRQLLITPPGTPSPPAKPLLLQQHLALQCVQRSYHTF